MPRGRKPNGFKELMMLCYPSEFSLTCEDCGCDESDRNLSKEEVVLKLMKHGWKFEDGNVLCPDCAASSKSKKAS